MALNTLSQLVENLNLSHSDWEMRGPSVAKLKLSLLSRLPISKNPKLILVTALSPTPAGEGKTTTAIGLNDGLCKMGENSVACLRQPSLGPVFGQKGGATGGGKSQLVPSADINLGFTGDFSAIESAHNLLAALIDNHLFQGNELEIDSQSLTWRRVMDMNDRALRSIVTGLGKANGTVRESGFDITAASELMAILCLAESVNDLKNRISQIVLGRKKNRAPLRAQDLQAVGAMTALLRNAIKPNLVQSLDGNPVLVHGGPFANIAHGCSSVIATRMALNLAEYVVTECGFGADLGAEKFLHIKCGQTGLWPHAAVCVATLRALKYHGGIKLGDLSEENTAGLEKGLANLKRHVENLKKFNLPVVVSLNEFPSDTSKEREIFKSAVSSWGAEAVFSNPFGAGGEGCLELAGTIKKICSDSSLPAAPSPLYHSETSLAEKILTVATQIYGAKDVSLPPAVKKQLEAWEAEGYRNLPVCMAKTQYSFSSNPKLLGAPSGHTLEVQSVRLSAGAGFVVVICGDLLLMPGLPKAPASQQIDCDENGNVLGL